MTARKMLLGLGSPFSQTRVDLNLLYGTDSAAGTIPPTNPAYANDGNPATSATRASSGSNVVNIVQFVSADHGVGTGDTVFASPVTAGNLLMVFCRLDPSNPGNVTKGGTISDRLFVNRTVVTVNSGARTLYCSTRVATGDEQTLTWRQNDDMEFLYELALAGSPSGFQYRTATEQAATFSKSLSAFSAPGDLQIEAFMVISDHQLFTVGSGWTLDAQRGSRSTIVDISGHSITAPTPNITGNSDATGVAPGAWGGIGVGVTTGSPVAYDSRLVADLGVTRHANRMTLLSADTTTQYEIAWSSDGSTWHVITPLAFTTGSPQVYDFAEVAARYWSIRDTHAGGIVAALTWSTWTVEGFPF